MKSPLRTVVLLLFIAAASSTLTLAAEDDAAIHALLARIEDAAGRGDQASYLGLLAATADADTAQKFAAAEFRSPATRVVLQERDRQPLTGTLPGNGYSLIIDAFMQHGDRARVATWQLDLKKADEEWHVANQERLSSVDTLYHLSLNPRQQFEATDFSVAGEDLELVLTTGSVFTIDTDQGVTGLVLLGRGRMRFKPAPAAERGQVRIFAGSETLDTTFDAAFVRLGTVGDHADMSRLTPRPVDPKLLRRAEQVFKEESVKSFGVDLADLTRESWSLLPGSDDFLAEIRTRRFETLTYTRSALDAEDISLFDRQRHRNIAVYPSKQKLATRGRFYNEDELAAYDVLDYDINVVALPERQWIEGTTKMRLRVRAPALGQLTIRLADTLVVRSIVSGQFGRLFSLRVMNQNAVLVNLPATVLQDTELTLTIDYGGRLEPQPPDREGLALAQRAGGATLDWEETPFPRLEPTYLYSNRTYWYPQAPISDYATATIQIAVPAVYGCVATGDLSSSSPQLVPGKDESQARKIYLFNATRPVRYLSFLVSRLARADRWTVRFDRPEASKAPAPSGQQEGYTELDLVVDANPRQVSRGREVAERAVDIVQFYQSLVGDSPYPSFTVAIVENATPGGHSPGYFAALNQPLPSSNVVWRNDPAAFPNFPEFFLAHEIAHQWWGQAVGWRNYHEQWLSEGFAQYFAALYAQHHRGDSVFENLLRQMRKWAVDQSEQGPVYLGYRVGHIRGDGRAFRAIVYNKAALVLHMLRLFVGDEPFFRGLRQFYADSRYRKVGSDDFRRAIEAASDRSLDRFFERWIYETALPRLSFGYQVEDSPRGPVVLLRLEQEGELFDIPVTVTLQYVDRRPVEVVIPVSDRLVERRIPLAGTLKTAEVNKDSGMMAHVGKSSARP